MEETKAVVEYKLNIFQKLRRSAFLFGMNSSKARKYKNLPEYLKNDEKVLEAIAKTNPAMLSKIPSSFAISYIKENPEVLKEQYYDISFKKTIIENDPQMIVYFEECDLFNFIYNENIDVEKNFIKYLPEDLQLKILSKTIQYHELILDNNEELSENKLRIKEGRPEDVEIDQISGDVIVKFALIDEQNKRRYESHFKNSVYPLKLLDRNIEILPIDVQLKLMCVDEEYKVKCSEDAVNVFNKKDSKEYDDAFHCINENLLYYSDEFEEESVE